MKFSIGAATCFALCTSFAEAFVIPSKTINNNYAILSSREQIIQSQSQPQSRSNQPALTFLKATSSSQELDSEENENAHPSDPASTTPQLLAALWHLIAAGCRDLNKGQSFSVLYPNMEAQFSSDPTYLERLMGHLDACKDVCDNFGVNTILSPIIVQDVDSKGRTGNVVTGFTVKSYKDPNKIGTFASDGNFEFAPDPYFDNDDWDILDEQIRLAAEEDAADNDDLDEDDGYSSGAGDVNASASGSGSDDEGKDSAPLPDIVDKIPDSDEKIINVSKTWVDKMMSDMGICPFTKGAELAGLPMGQVFYTVDRSTNIEDMYAVYWEEVVRVEQNDEKELSTTLLIAPEFLIDNVEMFENFSGTLTQPLEALGVEVSLFVIVWLLFIYLFVCLFASEIVSISFTVQYILQISILIEY